METKRISRCGKNASLKLFTGAVIIIEVGAIVYNATTSVFTPTLAIDPVSAVVNAAPLALTAGAMLGTWSYVSCHKSKYF